ncbi:MAG: hypothetical protein GYA41_12625 [Bacteroidales bacterium]|nr:hypothetical protein [Bacteroidales bacterium]
MRKFRKYWIAIVSIFILFGIIYFAGRSLKSEALSYFQVPPDTCSITTIGIVGDSWVEDKRLDTIIQRYLADARIEARILSSHQGGAESKQVYQNLFKEHSVPHSSRFVIESRPDYCIVVAGVNDASSRVGPSYYSHHMTLIIKTLLHYGIVPFIVSLPEFGIEEIPENMNMFTGTLWKIRNSISATLNNKGRINSIITYRNKLISDLELDNLLNRVILIDFDLVCDDFCKCQQLYVDRGHLSKCGDTKLCRIIADKLIETINK